MNNKTKRLVIGVLIFLAAWGFNFVKGQISGGAGGIDQTTTQIVTQTTTQQANHTNQPSTTAGDTTTAERRTTTVSQAIKAETIDDLVELGLLEEITKNGKTVGWQSQAGLFYGMGSKEGNRVKHVFEHLKPNPDKPIHSVFETDKAGLIILIDEAWQKRDGAYTKAQSNGNRIYDVDMERRIGTNGEYIIRIVVRDGSEKIITAYPKK